MDFSFAWQALTRFVPETVLVLTFIMALIADAFFKQRLAAAIIAFLGVAYSGWKVVEQMLPTTAGGHLFDSPALIFTGTTVTHPPYGMYIVDSLSIFFKLLLAVAALYVIAASWTSREVNEEGRENSGEYYALIVAALFGMFLMTGVTDILMMYIAIELVSISSYILAGFTKNVYRSSEAALKYVVFGAAASGLMLYGFSLLFGLTGTTNLFEINEFLMAHPVNPWTLLLSGVLILVGFGYKISAVPFHFWTPDVYEGAPIPVTAYLSVASKAAGFAMLIRFLLIAYPVITKDGFEWNILLTIVCVMTMSLGNLVAIQQTNMKRLLAYSSIAQAGYMLMGVVVLSMEGITSVLIYFITYLFMNLGAFYVVQTIADRLGSEEIEDFRGLGKRMPLMSGLMVVFMMSLTGIPMTAGFVGKLFLFNAVLARTDAVDPSRHPFIWLAIVGVLNSVVSLYYYMKVVRAMYLDKGDEGTEPIPVGAAPVAIALMLGVPTIVLGLWWAPIVNFAQRTVEAFVMQ
jgi:NADH-quinone oxidoreductase subunit N